MYKFNQINPKLFIELKGLIMGFRMNCLLPDLSILQRYEPPAIALVNYFSISPGEIFLYNNSKIHILKACIFVLILIIDFD